MLLTKFILQDSQKYLWQKTFFRQLHRALGMRWCPNKDLSPLSMRNVLPLFVLDLLVMCHADPTATSLSCRRNRCHQFDDDSPGERSIFQFSFGNSENKIKVPGPNQVMRVVNCKQFTLSWYGMWWVKTNHLLWLLTLIKYLMMGGQSKLQTTYLKPHTVSTRLWCLTLITDESVNNCHLHY